MRIWLCISVIKFTPINRIFVRTCKPLEVGMNLKWKTTLLLENRYFWTLAWFLRFMFVLKNWSFFRIFFFWLCMCTHCKLEFPPLPPPPPPLPPACLKFNFKIITGIYYKVIFSRKVGRLQCILKFALYEQLCTNVSCNCTVKHNRNHGNSWDRYFDR